MRSGRSLRYMTVALAATVTLLMVGMARAGAQEPDTDLPVDTADELLERLSDAADEYLVGHGELKAPTGDRSIDPSDRITGGSSSVGRLAGEPSISKRSGMEQALAAVLAAPPESFRASHPGLTDAIDRLNSTAPAEGADHVEFDGVRYDPAAFERFGRALVDGGLIPSAAGSTSASASRSGANLVVSGTVYSGQLSAGVKQADVVLKGSFWQRVFLFIGYWRTWTTSPAISTDNAGRFAVSVTTPTDSNRNVRVIASIGSRTSTATVFSGTRKGGGTYQRNVEISGLSNKPVLTSFTRSPSSARPGDTVYYVVNAANSPIYDGRLTCTVEFGDGRQQTKDCRDGGATDFTHTYAKSGNYTARVTVENPGRSGQVVTGTAPAVRIDSGLRLTSLRRRAVTGLITPTTDLKFDYGIENPLGYRLECAIMFFEAPSDGPNPLDFFDAATGKVKPFACDESGTVSQRYGDIPGFESVLLASGWKDIVVGMMVRDASGATDYRTTFFRMVDVDYKPAITSFGSNRGVVASGTPYELSWRVEDPAGVAWCDLEYTEPDGNRVYLSDVGCNNRMPLTMTNHTKSQKTVEHVLYATVGTAGFTTERSVSVQINPPPRPTVDVSFADDSVEPFESSSYTVSSSGDGLTCERRLWNTAVSAPPYKPSSCNETFAFSTDDEGEWKVEVRVTDVIGQKSYDFDRIWVDEPAPRNVSIDVTCYDTAGSADEEIDCSQSPLPSSKVTVGRTVTVSGSASGVTCTSRRVTVPIDASDPYPVRINCQ